MRVLIIGAAGQLGTDLCRVFKDDGLIPLKHSDIEITDMDSVRRAITVHRPETVIDTAAYIRVDDCETEKDRAFAINTLGARNVAVVCQEIGAKLVYISTDYVFGGGSEVRRAPYTEFDDPIPLNVYGQSKLAGERLVCHLCHKYFIVRTSGLFGLAGASGKGGNFVETALNLARTRPELRIVNDQTFSPTYSQDLARALARLSATQYFGTYHITNSGACTWYEFSREIVRMAGLTTPVFPLTSEQYPQKARRPSYSVLNNYHMQLLGWEPLRPWQDALSDYLRQKGYSHLEIPNKK
jgi:dTDP-4-dehydrorhamnose reductase